MYGLALDCAERRVLGDDVDIRITAWDETNTRIRPDAIVEQIRASGGRGLVCLVGVQTNQFPRAVDIARPLRAAGIPVCLGGFHVSGCLAMLPDMPPELQAAMDLGITLFAGEAEGRLDDLLRDAWRGRARAALQLHERPPGPGGRSRAVPAGRRRSPHVRRCARASTPAAAAPSCAASARSSTCRDASRAARSADDVERLVRANLAQGVHNFFITDDNLARNRNWEAIFDRLIAMREERGPAHPRRRAGGHDVPQDPRLHREGGPGRRQSRVHRPGEHQPGVAEGRAEGPEPDHRVPRDAAGVAPRRRADLRRLHPRASRATRRSRSSATSASSSASSRSTSSSSSSSRRCRAPPTTRSCTWRAWRWSPT